MFLRRLTFAAGLLAMAALALLANSVAATDFDRAVLARLSRAQIIAYLQATDAGLNDDQRGAKYRWGAVPLDREPPHALGIWWSRLAPAERDEQMVAWFNSHSRAISLDDVRARLNIDPLIHEVRAQRGPDPARETVPWWLQRGAADTGAATVRVRPPATATEPPARSVIPIAPLQPAPRTALATASPTPTAPRLRPARPAALPAAATRPRPATPARPAAPPLRPAPGIAVPPATNAAAVNGSAGSVAAPPVAGGDAPPVVHQDALPVTLRNSE